VIGRFAAPHRRWLVRGIAGTVGVVVCRFAMPWPMRGLLEAAFPGARHRAAGLVRHLPDRGDPVLWLALGVVAIAVALGVGEMIQRVNMSRFASLAVGDLRVAALRGAARRARRRDLARGDLIARVLGDTARLKEDLRGILVHATQNALLFAAICALFLVLSPKVGGIFLFGGLAACAIAYRAAAPLEELSAASRRREGEYAETIRDAVEHGRLAGAADETDAESHKASRAARLQTLSSLVVHGVLGLTTAITLYVGVAEVRADRLAPGELFLFAAYLITAHRRIVQLGRQLTRIGRVRACLARIATLVAETDLEPNQEPLRLERRLAIEAVTVASTHGRPRLRAFDLTLAPRSRVALLGRPGDGKSTLLRLLAGMEIPEQGAVRWDDVVVAPHDPRVVEAVAFLPQDPVFPRLPVRRILGVTDGAALTEERRQTLVRVGAWRVIERLSRGLAHKIGSGQLSKNEARAIALGTVVCSDAPVWVLDAPDEGLRRKDADERLAAILDAAVARTVVISAVELREPERFDRIVVLRRGEVRFDGDPAHWRDWKLTKNEEDHAGTDLGSRAG